MLFVNVLQTTRHHYKWSLCLPVSHHEKRSDHNIDPRGGALSSPQKKFQPPLDKKNINKRLPPKQEIGFVTFQSIGNLYLQSQNKSQYGRRLPLTVLFSFLKLFLVQISAIPRTTFPPAAPPLRAPTKRKMVPRREGVNDTFFFPFDSHFSLWGKTPPRIFFFPPEHFTVLTSAHNFTTISHA